MTVIGPAAPPATREVDLLVAACVPIHTGVRPRTGRFTLYELDADIRGEPRPAYPFRSFQEFPPGVHRVTLTWYGQGPTASITVKPVRKTVKQQLTVAAASGAEAAGFAVPDAHEEVVEAIPTGAQPSAELSELSPFEWENATVDDLGIIEDPMAPTDWPAIAKLISRANARSEVLERRVDELEGKLETLLNLLAPRSDA